MSRYRHLLTMTFALCMIAPPLARADYVYSFSGETAGGTVDSFTFTTPTLIQSNSDTVVINWTSCVSGGITCSFIAFESGGSPPNDMLQIDDGPGDYYFFASGTFSQVGQYTTDSSLTSALSLAFGPSIGTGTLSITNTSAVPEPSTLMLLGTGALGLLGPIRRNLLR